jgi:putative redox protein
LSDTKVTWQGKLSFTGTGRSGFSVPLGASAAVGGDEDGFRPMELIATGLAACTAMDVISILFKKRQDVTAFEVLVHADQASTHPKVFTRAVIEFYVTGHALDETAVLRSIELSATVYCPAQAMFSKIMPVELKYYIFDDMGEGERKLVSSGTYVLPEEQTI